MRWIVISPVDSIIHLLNSPGLLVTARVGVLARNTIRYTGPWMHGCGENLIRSHKLTA